MICQDAQLVAAASATGRVCRVEASTLLSDLVQQIAADYRGLLLAMDEAGDPIGVVDFAEVRRRVESPNPSERRRWRDTPVEALLAGRLQIPHELSPALATPTVPDVMSCTTVACHGRLLGILTDDDLLVSWRSIEQTVRQARIDSLTLLPNRAAFDDSLRTEFSRAERFRHSVGVVLIDVDFFKSINDRFGHAAGDSALEAVARTLRRSLRSYDFVARYGGDEFAAICCGCLPGEIEVTLRRLRQGMLRLQEETGIPHPVPTVCMGACVVHDFSGSASPETILEYADECLYVAKRSGRNCSFSTEICDRTQADAELQPVAVT